MALTLNGYRTGRAAHVSRLDDCFDEPSAAYRTNIELQAALAGRLEREEFRAFLFDVLARYTDQDDLDFIDFCICAYREKLAELDGQAGGGRVVSMTPM